MPGPETLLAAGMGAGLVLYFVLGGADFGGGVWDLLASGPRKAEQRALIAHAIGPVWEANHVWLIFVLVLLFSGFPRAFSAITVALHVPLTLFLVGVVLRGSAFAFQGGTLTHSARPAAETVRRRWGRVFAWASLVAPVLLGVCVGALASGEIRVLDGRVASGFFSPWLGPFPLGIGLLALGECALLAAAFLAVEAKDEGDLAGDFRARALWTGAAVAAVAGLDLLLSRWSAPRIFEGLLSGGALGLVAGAVAALGAALWAIRARRYALGRAFAVAHVALVLGGWAAAQAPYLVVPDVTIASASSNPVTQRAVLWAVAAGLPVLGPSLWLLFRIFKSGRAPTAR